MMQCNLFIWTKKQTESQGICHIKKTAITSFLSHVIAKANEDDGLAHWFDFQKALGEVSES